MNNHPFMEISKGNLEFEKVLVLVINKRKHLLLASHQSLSSRANNIWYSLKVLSVIYFEIILCSLI